jgi:pimeloyl-ACP methyl ester carboxylesterase
MRNPSSASARVTAITALGLAFGLLQAVPSGAEPAADAAAAFTPTLTSVDCPDPTSESFPLPPPPVGPFPLPPRTTCYTLTVPLDWSTPTDGRTVDILLTVTSAKRKPGRLGLTWNPGGPGGEAVQRVGEFYAYMPKSIQDNFDFVSWDPRGVGLSEPKLQGCVPASVQPADTGPVDWEAYWQEVADVSGAATRACIAANPDVAPYLGTWQVVRDMEAMRQALGYAKWNYWGMSYGTRVGNTYARTFPSRLRAFIQDGSVMANESITRFGSTTPAGDYATLQVYASIKGKKQGKKLEVIFDFLDDYTLVPAGGGAPITRWSLMEHLNENMRKPALLNDLPGFVNVLYAAVKAQEAGQPRKAARAVQKIDPLIVVDDNSDSFLTDLINCVDLPDRPTVASLARMSEAAETNYGTAYGTSVVRASSCLGVPSEFSTPVNDDYSLLKLATPPLFLLTTGDAGTPWVWGRSLANTFVGSKVMTYDSTEHVSFFRTPSACMKSAAEKYLLSLTLPRKDGFCEYATYVPPVTN